MLGGVWIGSVALFALFAIAYASPLAQSEIRNTTRVYFLAVEEVAWDYAPSNYDLFHGVPLSESADAAVFCERGDTRIGKVYFKAIYTQYTDSTFSTRVVQPAWLGFVGPVIRAEVADTIEVYFKNMASRPYSVHPHGVFYTKDNEGALYNDGVAGKKGAAIAPGDTYKYSWTVPARAGPGPADASSIMWSYHSHVNEAKDTYSGLVGALIIYNSGLLDSQNRPKDIDREVVVMLQVQDENLSWYIEDNIRYFTYKPDEVDPTDDGFIESNLMHSINGYVYSNLPDLFVCEGEKVRWYLMAFGTEVDLHTFHWHGQTLTEWGHRLDVMELLPASMHIADMVPDAPALSWVAHCHVNDHMSAGMSLSYQVASRSECAKGFQPVQSTMNKPSQH